MAFLLSDPTRRQYANPPNHLRLPLLHLLLGEKAGMRAVLKQFGIFMSTFLTTYVRTGPPYSPPFHLRFIPRRAEDCPPHLRKLLSILTVAYPVLPPHKSALTTTLPKPQNGSLSTPVKVSTQTSSRSGNRTAPGAFDVIGVAEDQDG